MATAAQRILVIAPEPFYEDRGTPIAVRRTIENLSVIGRHVDLLTYPVGDDFEAPGLRILRGPNPFGFRSVPIGLSLRKIVLDLALLPMLFRQIRSGRYQVVHALEELAFPACAIARMSGVPLVYDMQSSLPEQLAYRAPFHYRPVQWALRRIEDWLLRSATTVVCSAGLADHVRHRVPDAQVCEWLYPMHLEPEPAGDRSALLGELGIDGNARLVVYAGNFAEYQGLKRLLDAIPIITQRVPRAVFLLVGADRPEHHELWGMCREEREAGRIVVLARQPHARVADLLPLAHVLVSPRDSIGNAPLKIFEYMEAGRPIVASNCEAHRAVLDPDCARLVGPAAGEWAAAIAGLLENPDEGRALAARASQRARERLGSATFQEMLDRLYAGAVGNGADRGDHDEPASGERS